MITSEDWSAIALTLRLAALSTLILLALATPLAWWLARTRSVWRTPVAALTSLPLVLPPTVLGFYLLVMLGPSGPGGQITQMLGLGLLPFTFGGLLIGSVIYSLPFAIQPLQHAFHSIGSRPIELAATLRASPLDAFINVAIPLAWPGFVSAGVLSFAHTLGEFGMVLMIGGNIPGQTRVISTQLYGHVEALAYDKAHTLAAGMLIFSFVVLLGLNLLQERKRRVGN